MSEYSVHKDRLIKKQAERITELMKDKCRLEKENAILKKRLSGLAQEKIKNLSGGVKFEDTVEKLHYEHWVDETLKKRI